MSESQRQGRSLRPSRESLRAEARRLYVDERLSTRAVAARLGTNTTTLRLILTEAGVARRSISEAKAGQGPTPAVIEASVRARRKYVLPGRPAVGYKVNGDGYVMLYMPGHPMADGAGYVKEHRLVLSQKLGRLLEPQEDGHHLDHVRTNNAPDNLELKESRAEHQREHSTTRNRRPDGSFAPAGEGQPKVGSAPCSVPGCDRPSKQRGWCPSHWFWARGHAWQAPTHLIGQAPYSPRAGSRRDRAAAGPVDPSVPRVPGA